ncbi:MAG: hypothetical protein JWO39_1257, partial [Gemmatimonadetes bacterium]|nr:hypothetical protein [Gemmatimonadota bacterium]
GILEQRALDLGDIEGTIGLDTDSEHESTAEIPWTTMLSTWIWERMRGYPATRDRRAALESYLDFRMATPTPPPRRPGFS